MGEKIKIITSENKSSLPISVIVSVMPDRQEFFKKYCLPMIIINNPKEIIINESEEGAALKWNESFKKTTQPYVFLCSDDFILPAGHLIQFLNSLKDTPENIGYAYTSSYYCFCLNGKTEDTNFKYNSIEFDEEIKKKNFIDGSCLWKRKNWVDFDTTLKRLLDWEIALRNFIENGISGIMVPDSEFLTIRLDEGISSKNNLEEATLVILKKFNLDIKDNLYYNDFYLNSEEYKVKYTSSIYFTLWGKVIGQLMDIPQPKILEIGCGSGQFANMLWDLGFKEYTGFDFSETAIEIAKQKSEQKFFVMDALNPESYNFDFNVLIILEVLEHTDDIKILSFISSGTQIIFTVPDFDFESHVRFFKDTSSVERRYEKYINIEHIEKFKSWFLVRGNKK